MLKRTQRLSELLQDHYSQNLLCMLESSFQINERSSWVNYILVKVVSDFVIQLDIYWLCVACVVL